MGVRMIVYRGPSMLDPTRTIVGVLTFDSANTKTGPMAQLWILCEDIAPHEAQKTGDDAAVCGDCPFRPLLAKGTTRNACYVRTFQGPRSTWASHRGEPVELELAKRRLSYGASLRLGAYGDPAALPRHIIESLAAACEQRITGYTHQWRHPQHAWLKAYVMASCDEVTDYARAKAEGWRTFRVIQKRMLPVLAKREIMCPSDVVECVDCMLCDGVSYAVDRRKDIAIHAH